MKKIVVIGDIHGSKAIEYRDEQDMDNAYNDAINERAFD